MIINPKSKNEYSQNSEEIIAMDLLCHFLNIPYNTVSQHESPDCIIELEGRKIGVEITTLRPSISLTKLLSGRAQGQNKNQIERVVRILCFECMKNHEIFDISIRFMLRPELYFTSYKINAKKNILRDEIEDIFIQLQNDIDKQHTNIQSYSYKSDSFLEVYITYYPNAGWKKEFEKDKDRINIYFTFEGFLSPMPFDFIKPAIINKEAKIESYKKKNPDINDYWLCLFLPDEEFGFTIKGVESPPQYESSYSRIFLAQNCPPFVRYL